MFTITPEVASLGVSPPRQRLEGDYDDDETTNGCLLSRQRSRALGCLRRARSSIDVRCAIVQSTSSQLFKSLKHVAIVRY